MNKFKNTPVEARKIVSTALKSGEYIQGTGQLTKIIGQCEMNCCLGVAIKEFIKHEPGHYIQTKILTPHYEAHSTVMYGPNNETGGLLEIVQEWLGYTYKYGRLKTPVKREAEKSSMCSNLTNLSDLNDEHWTFAKIAEIMDNDGVECEK